MQSEHFHCWLAIYIIISYLSDGTMILIIQTARQPSRFYGQTVERSWLAKSSHLTSVASNWACVSLAEDQTEGKRPQNKQEMNMAAAQAWQSITREHAKCLLMSMDHEFQTVTEFKGFATKYLI